jgi:large subunit ribosomal protein L15
MPELRAPKNARRPKRIVGRGKGSGRGGTSGKGHKGQNSRAGGSVRPGFEGGQMPLYRRIARRGFSNYPFKRVAEPVNLHQLQSAFKSGDVVSLESLREKGVVGRRVDFVKILGSGEIKKKLTVKGLKVSANAARKITDAGGTVEGFEAAAEPDAPTTEEQDS